MLGLEEPFPFGVLLERDQTQSTGRLMFRRYEPARDGKLLYSPTTHDQTVDFPVQTGTLTYTGVPMTYITRAEGREGYPWEISRPNMGTPDDYPMGSNVKFKLIGVGFAENAGSSSVLLQVGGVNHPIEIIDDNNAFFVLPHNAGTKSVTLVRGDGLTSTGPPPPNLNVMHKVLADVHVGTQLRAISPRFGTWQNVQEMQQGPTRTIQRSNFASNVTVIETPWFAPNPPAIRVGTQYTISGAYLKPPAGISGLARRRRMLRRPDR
jgi:hypothetical protein